MNQIKLFIELTRLKRPIGFMLLFWPCLWGLTIVYDFNSDLKIYFFYSALFLSGSILMRSAGCIVNDIVDKNFDKKVERTKNRPIASGKVSVKLASTYALFLCAIAFLVLINFNNFTILMALASMPLAFTYPLMKRITYWPQLFLGIKDDEIIGVKSTSINFKNDPKKFLFISYSFFIISLFLVGILMKFKIYYFLFMIIPILHLLVFQVRKLNTNQSIDCFSKFKSNNFLGAIILINILIGKLI